VAVLVALAGANHHDHPLAFDVRDLQAKRFGDPQTTAVHHRGAHVNRRATNQADQTMRFFSIEHYRELHLAPGSEELQRRPRPLQGLVEQELDSEDLRTERTAGDMLLVHKVREVVAQLLLGEFIGCAMVVAG